MVHSVVWHRSVLRPCRETRTTYVRDPFRLLHHPPCTQASPPRLTRIPPPAGSLPTSPPPVSRKMRTMPSRESTSVPWLRQKTESGFAHQRARTALWMVPVLLQTANSETRPSRRTVPLFYRDDRDSNHLAALYIQARLCS